MPYYSLEEKSVTTNIFRFFRRFVDSLARLSSGKPVKDRRPLVFRMLEAGKEGR